MVADERSQEFDELVRRVLEEPEFTVAMAGEHAPSAADLRAAALAQRGALLGHARAAEQEYREAAGRAQSVWSRRRRVRVIFWAGGAFALLVALAAIMTGAWNDEFKAALIENRPVSMIGVVGSGIGLLLTSIVIAAVAGRVAFALFSLLPRVRAGNESARYSWSADVALFVMTALVVAGASAADQLFWQMAHNRPAGDDDGYAWGTPVSLIVGALFVAPYLLFLQASEGAGVQVWRRGLLAPDNQDAERLRAAWWDSVAEALRGLLRAQIGAHITRRHALTLHLKQTPGLRQVRGLAFHVSTAAEETLTVVANGMDGGSIALSGPRGVGKTDLLHAFCGDGSERLGLVISAPVVYERREFMLGLFAQLCRSAIAAELKTAAGAAAKHLEWIHYLQTRTSEASMNAGWQGFGISAKRGGSRARQPLTYLEIVDALKGFLHTLADELTTTGLKPRGLVVGIDELDRIEPAARARDFVNELKVVFDVPNCLFLLSVSDEALREADLAPVGRRDAFDSAIDEIIRVEPLDLATATRLLDTRAVGLPVPFAALFHCLSGGMPRDLLRTARAAAALIVPDRPRTLPEITAALLTRESARLADDRGFLRTIEQIFTAELTLDRLTRASDSGFPGSFDALARVRRDLGVADERAGEALREIRKAWDLPG
ncbi:hypothetical protein GCM10009555_028420 [Acrocarpospora macrocephala]|uniref:KAP NTPase domain-containing protein n=1 Tax=Acrocarpospora macrocephala TaxID=150177 RepID=A0A5M3X6T7_9ACTN|nr:P-loop NTPase fold protein [Acrocarpospora macrocephala]GES15859.1 hypothetical protein Amac_094570 [Acrocarpospora macrocephala]